MFEKRLEQRRHGAVPQREEEDPVLRPAHVVAGLHERRRQLAALELGPRAQQRKVELRDLDAPHLVAR